MKANEMRKLATNYQLSLYITKFKEEAMKGKFVYRINASDIKQVTVDELKNLGYYIGNDEGTFVVRWDEDVKDTRNNDPL